ncbi:MAG: hypothetical protein IJX77_07425 [Ruminococcus sp.]|nr:hypothetical protein [Ruminococcus sp.]
MKKFLNSLFAFLLIFGIIAAFGFASDAMLSFSDKTVSLNESVKSDYDEAAKVEGEVYYVYDQIAVQEVTRTRYGIETGTQETYFYLIESYNKDWYTDMESDYEPLTLVYATGDKDKAAKLDEMVEAWYDFEEKYMEWAYDENASEDDYPKEPSLTFDISGVITEAPDAKVIDYRDDYIADCLTDDVEEYIDQYCVDMIIQDKDLGSSRIIFFAGIAGAVVGLIGLIAMFIGSRKAKKAMMADQAESVQENNIDNIQ